MEKKNTSPTVAEQKQILETCVHKLEEVNACVFWQCIPRYQPICLYQIIRMKN